MSTNGSLGMVVPVAMATIQTSTAPTSCMPVVTRRLPTRLLASAEKRSRVPQQMAAPSPVSRPTGIGGA